MALPTTVLDRLLEITVLLQRDMTRAFEDTPLTLARTQLLWEVHRRGPSTQQALAAALEVSPRNITGLVDALEAPGYVARRPHPSDRRATLVTLTDLGTTTMVAMVRDHEHLAADLVRGIPGAEVSLLAEQLGGIADRLRDLTAAAKRRAS